MKIVIKEAAFRILMSDYLDRMFMKSKRRTGEMDKINYIWFADQNENPSLVWNVNKVDDKIYLGIRKDLYSLIRNLFSLNDEDVNQLVKEWFKKRGKLKADELYTF